MKSYAVVRLTVVTYKTNKATMNIDSAFLVNIDGLIIYKYIKRTVEKEKSCNICTH